jgi:hypothetical protein
MMKYGTINYKGHRYILHASPVNSKLTPKLIDETHLLALRWKNGIELPR